MILGIDKSDVAKNGHEIVEVVVDIADLSDPDGDPVHVRRRLPLAARR